jgi:hypothetical protein
LRWWTRRWFWGDSTSFTSWYQSNFEIKQRIDSSRYISKVSSMLEHATRRYMKQIFVWSFLPKMLLLIH